jgi:integrase
MKREANLAPTTIRHRHGALARCFDWMTRKHPDVMVQNPLRLLERGFATYTDQDAAKLAKSGKRAREDTERDRRLLSDEENAILDVLVGEERTFFLLALETAMRMRECYTLDVSQVNLAKRTIYLERSKNGDNRQVPLSSVACALLKDYIKANRVAIDDREGRLYSYWNGDLSVPELDRTTAEVSRVFRVAFARAAAFDFHFHDLRHEATCRLYERTKLSDVLIAKITGHRDIRMLRRYASLSG